MLRLVLLVLRSRMWNPVWRSALPMTLAAAVLLAFAGMNPSSDQGAPDRLAFGKPASVDLLERVEALDEITEELPPAQTRRLLRVATRAVAEGRVPVHLLDGAVLAAEDARAFTLPGGQALVQIPIRGRLLAAQSNLSLVLNGSAKLAGSAEIQLLADPEAPDRGRVTAWNNGRLVVDKVVTDDGRVSPPSSGVAERSATQEVQLVAFSVSKFRKCLNRQGVAAWVINAIMIACAAICVATAGVACWVCIAAAGGATGTVLRHCYNRARS
jgi:hypothetical protein